MYAGKCRGAVDEASAASKCVRRLRREPNLPSLSLAEFNALVREQLYMPLIDQEAALGSIPKMLPEDGERARRASISSSAFSLHAGHSTTRTKRLARIARLFDLVDAAAGLENVIP